ncbi:rRNA-binding ribosome biosynthesis protein utp25 [Tulasnella sp. 425]|nr:rRNA-binding ribosome biosynthesis protein utp25 [Tulasnella sp. 425]
MTEASITTAKLLALLNVDAARPRKRLRQIEETETTSVIKLNRKRSEVTVEETITTTETTVEEEVIDDDENEDNEGGNAPNDIEVGDLENWSRSHFGNKSSLLTNRTLEAIAPPGEHSRVRWKVDEKSSGPGRTTVLSTLEDREGVIQDAVVTPPVEPSAEILNKLWEPFHTRSEKLPEHLQKLQGVLLPELLSCRDVHHSYISASDGEEQSALRDAVTLHLVNHVWKRQAIIASNNARQAQASKTGSDPPSPDSIQDQGFTRPSTLVIVPFRNSALRWITSYMSHFTGQSNSKTEVANRERFISEFSLPEGTVDKLAEAEGMGIYPPDHVHTFKGNIDDNFRAGIRVMKKVLKLFETFYGSDLIVASPLGLRLAIEREGNSDFLSSIEILVIDQADVMTMQNWTHLQFVFEHLNNLPRDPRDTDFSRVKSWFLDGHARHLRQNILISSYETPQIRALFNDNFRNIAGKVRFERRWSGVDIPEGIKQNFVKFECTNGRDEADARFEYFTKEFFPSLKKSAVLSANTLLFIPSYFDFIRVRNWMKQNASVSVAFISEESSKSEIDRARAQFMKGQKAFLVITERFHFFRRIKGILNVIFYGPPDHANFYSELLTYPFFKKDVEPSEVTCKVLFSKYDAMALERLVGTKEAAALIRGS